MYGSEKVKILYIMTVVVSGFVGEIDMSCNTNPEHSSHCSQNKTILQSTVSAIVKKAKAMEKLGIQYSDITGIFCVCFQNGCNSYNAVAAALAHIESTAPKVAVSAISNEDLTTPSTHIENTTSKVAAVSNINEDITTLPPRTLTESVMITTEEKKDIQSTTTQRNGSPNIMLYNKCIMVIIIFIFLKSM